MKMRGIVMPTKLLTFTHFWRSRGMSIRGAYKLWRKLGIPFLPPGVRPQIAQRDIEWAKRV